MTELSPVGAVQEFSRWKFYFTRHYERCAGSIGTPLPETKIELTDVPEQDIRVKRDGKGEMVVSGPQVMQGYYRDPATTAGAMPDGALRTGDIARRDSSGRLFVVGRAKHVIVLSGGKKVFPEEDLREPLSGCPSIEQFAARPIEDSEGEEMIGIVVKPDAEQVTRRSPGTRGELLRLVKSEIDDALSDKPTYMRRYDLCVTELEDGKFRDLETNSMGEPSPLKTPFVPERSYAERRDDDSPLPEIALPPDVTAPDQKETAT
jgi:long-subunit acyl-CoA synthetase (AMP-forming)